MNNNCSKRKVGIHFLKKFLYCEIFFNVLHYAQVDGAKDTANYKNDRQGSNVRLSLHLVQPLVFASAAYSQIPLPLMTKVLCVLHFFLKFVTFLERIKLSLPDI